MNIKNNVIVLFSICMLALYVLMGMYSQPSSDDFCFAYKAIRIGYINSQLEWYLGWTGRYTSTALITALTYIDFTKYYWFFSTALIFSTSYAVYFIVRSLGGAQLSKREAIGYSIVLTVVYLFIQTSTAESIYWLSGAYTYQSGNVLYILSLAIYAKSFNVTNKLYLLTCVAISSVLVFISSGTNELTMVLCFVTYFTILIIAYLYKLENRLYLVLPFIASLMGVAAVMGAPGNVLRSTLQRYPDAHNIIGTISNSFYDMFYYLYHKFTSIPFISITLLSLMVTLPFICRVRAIFNGKDLLVKLFPVFYLSVLFLLFIPSYWATGLPSPARAVSVIDTWFLMGWFISAGIIISNFSKLSSVLLRREINMVLVLVYMVSFTISDKAIGVLDIEEGIGYRGQLEKRYQFIYESKKMNNLELVVPHLTNQPVPTYFEDISDNELSGPNACYASYFGLNSIKVD